MKQLFIFLSLTIFSFLTHAQVATGTVKDSIIKENNLSGKQWKAWYTLDSTWTHHIFPACLNENHVKLSCANCESVYLTVQLNIDSTGKLTTYNRISGKMCGNDLSKNIEKCMLDFFYFIEFPIELRNIILEVKLGNGLKC
jgi:hypothetical protein